MLRSLFVKDFAIIDRAELSFGTGMTVLTGETGAGKSLLVDALMLLSGARGDAAMVRAGAERAELAAEFDLQHAPELRAALSSLELNADDECRLRRVIRADGSSRAYVNDQPVTLATLRDLGGQLIEIHGQHEHQALLSRARQLALLDAWGNHRDNLAAVAQAAKRWQSVRAEIDKLSDRAGAGGELLDLMRFQLDELKRHALPPEQLRKLEDDHRRLSNAGELIQGCSALADLLDGEHEQAVRALLSRATGDIARLAALDPRLAGIERALSEAMVQLDEAMDELQRYLAVDDLDPERLSELDAQLARLHDLARKHRVPAAELAARGEQLSQEYEALAGADERLAQLNREIERARAVYDAAAQTLTKQRQTTATRLGKEVTRLMRELGMAGGRFSAQLSARAGNDPAAGGDDEIEFLVSANPGQAERPLRKVASGGELSRIGLAIEVAALGKDEVGTMVFDEVDSGVGGAVAEVVGRKLRQVAGARQVLCVTHLPQVAAQAANHISVRKRSDAKTTRTEIVALDPAARGDELARMLGGIEITGETRAHAEDMLRRAQAG